VNFFSSQPVKDPVLAKTTLYTQCFYYMPVLITAKDLLPHEALFFAVWDYDHTFADW